MKLTFKKIIYLTFLLLFFAAFTTTLVAEFLSIGEIVNIFNNGINKENWYELTMFFIEISHSISMMFFIIVDLYHLFHHEKEEEKSRLKHVGVFLIKYFAIDIICFIIYLIFINSINQVVGLDLEVVITIIALEIVSSILVLLIAFLDNLKFIYKEISTTILLFLLISIFSLKCLEEIEISQTIFISLMILSSIASILYFFFYNASLKSIKNKEKIEN